MPENCASRCSIVASREGETLMLQDRPVMYGGYIMLKGTSILFPDVVLAFIASAAVFGF